MKVTIVKIDGSMIEFIRDGGKDIEDAELENWVKLAYVKLGDAEVTIKNGKVEHCRMIDATKSPEKSNESTKNPDIVKISGKDFMTYEGLLAKRIGIADKLNKAKALKMLRSRILLHAQEKQKQKESQVRKEQIGTGDRSEKIRTYNYPQNRVTDHRIKKSYTLDKVLAGDLKSLIEDLRINKD